MASIRYPGATLTLAFMLAGCGGDGASSTSAPVAVTPAPVAVTPAPVAVAPAPLPTPTPTPAPSPTPTPSPTPATVESTKARLKVAAASGGLPGTFLGSLLELARVSAVTPIANRVFYRQDSGMFHFVGAIDAGPDSGANPTVRNYAVNYGAFKTSNEYFVEFDTNAPIIEIAYTGDGHDNANRVLVDGRYISTTNTVAPNDGARYVSRVTLPASAAFRHVRVETLNFSFIGVYLNQGDGIRQPATAPIRAIIMGDSYTEGGSNVAGVNDLSNYAAQTAQLLGWGDFFKSGVAGTGYLSAPGGTLKFRDRLATDVYPFKPEALVIAGGVNDPIVGLQDEAKALFDDIQAKLPTTIVFVVGSWDPKQEQFVADKSAAIRAAVGTRPNFYFLDNIGEKWQTGNGRVNAPNGSGNADTFVSADGGHPTQAGHDDLARRLAADIKSIIATF